MYPLILVIEWVARYWFILRLVKQSKHHKTNNIFSFSNSRSISLIMLTEKKTNKPTTRHQKSQLTTNNPEHNDAIICSSRWIMGKIKKEKKAQTSKWNFFFYLQIPLLTRFFFIQRTKKKIGKFQHKGKSSTKKTSYWKKYRLPFFSEWNGRKKRKYRRIFKEIPKHTINSKAMAHIWFIEFMHPKSPFFIGCWSILKLLY